MMDLLGNHSLQPAANAALALPGIPYEAPAPAPPPPATVVAVPILSLQAADSPRLNGEDKAHIARLAEMDTPLPPILVEKKTMRVIDGMHRLMATSLRGCETINVIFFDGSEADVFLRAVQENIAHGLPLSQSDRRAAAQRIIATHPHMSDRSIGATVGLGAKTVAAIRKSAGDRLPAFGARVGRDGRVRPLSSHEGRQRAAELLIQQPGASLRDVARAAGISPATVLDVRKRLQRGEPPVPGKPASGQPAPGSLPDSTGPGAGGSGPQPSPRPAIPPDPASMMVRLLRDPSLRSSERGKRVLRLLDVNAAGAEQFPDIAAAVPPHCVPVIAQLARQYAKMWQDLALELDGRARIIDPSTALRLNPGLPPGGGRPDGPGPDGMSRPALAAFIAGVIARRPGGIIARPRAPFPQAPGGQCP
jgi:hypothetical protein